MTPFKMAPRLTRAALLCATTMVALSATVAAAQTIPPTQDPAPAASQGTAPATTGPTAPAASPAAALPDSDQTPRHDRCGR
ncbi:hypothetical protein NHF48_017590 [Sphingomonas sp. H160509]|uniref:hypothetical protein n=1 Tax=Sphingomonas sp. H160509 TaxID=2955313 RepID=UPI0020978095|nr:hypothetical protein [Sphingomonas sp. H160509]MDD1452325.1 hypothetical protein [Sphingomonas sp. H160509]